MVFGSSVFQEAAHSELTSGRVVICVPTNGLVHAQFTYCLIEAIRYAESQGISVHVNMDEGTVLSNQRQHLAYTAVVDYRADHIMWLDSDMTFPADVILQLLKHNRDVVCATYSKRVKPFHATAFMDIDPVVPVPIKGRLKRVRYAGLGCMLVNADVMHRLPTPWFPLIWHESSQSWHGEDMGFCDLLEKENVSIYCDIELSLTVGHIGQQEFLLNRED